VNDRTGRRSTGRRSTRRRLLGGAVALGVAAGAAGWTKQHGAVRRAREQARLGFEAEDLTMPGDVVRHDVPVGDGATIHVVERGSGPALLLLHGMMLSSDIWVHQFTDLAARHRVVAVDLRGHGRSTAGNRPWTIETMADDLRAVVDALDLRRCLLVGHSMGGMVALALAQDVADERRLERFCGVVVVSSSPGPLVRLPGWPSLSKATAPAWRRALLMVERAGAAVPSDDVRWWMMRLGFGPEPVPAQVRFVEQLQEAMPMGSFARLAPMLGGVDLSPGLADVDLPVLVVVGSRDRLVGPRHARRTVDAVAQAQLVELPRCGHMPMLERRHEFSRLLDEFCAKVG
jgi:pimeloyl-ACP methyl ester carboxylesterase